MLPPDLSEEQRQSLAELAQTANDALLDAGQTGTNAAFNLGCTIGLLPVGIFTLLAWLLSKGSWAAAGITFFFTLLALIALANLAAFIAGRNSLQRTFHERLTPQIESRLQELQSDPQTFAQVAHQTLPPAAPLLHFLPHEAEPTPAEPAEDT